MTKLAQATESRVVKTTMKMRESFKPVDHKGKAFGAPKVEKKELTEQELKEKAERDAAAA